MRIEFSIQIIGWVDKLSFKNRAKCYRLHSNEKNISAEIHVTCKGEKYLRETY